MCYNRHRLPVSSFIGKQILNGQLTTKVTLFLRYTLQLLELYLCETYRSLINFVQLILYVGVLND